MYRNIDADAVITDEEFAENCMKCSSHYPEGRNTAPCGCDKTRCPYYEHLSIKDSPWPDSKFVEIGPIKGIVATFNAHKELYVRMKGKRKHIIESLAVDIRDQIIELAAKQDIFQYDIKVAGCNKGYFQITFARYDDDDNVYDEDGTLVGEFSGTPYEEVLYWIDADTGNAVNQVTINPLATGTQMMDDIKYLVGCYAVP